VLAGMSGQDTTATATKTRTAPNGARALPQAVLPSQLTAPPQAPSQDPSSALLDYLMGDN